MIRMEREEQDTFTTSDGCAIALGEEDYATPVAMARQLHEAIPQSTLTILPRARHLTPIECPEMIALELLSLLRACE